ncbi:Topoisomerase IA [Ruminococcus sp. SR1/5]|nr:Topoisomerase IA [Ruminococcus sp. SR1/5]
MKALVIAEKPSVAMALASVLGARTRKDGYVEGNGYIVSWCVGHLVGLCDASEYDEKYKKWRYEDLPIVPECWKHKILEGTKKQFGILKKLMRDSEVNEVICATDAGREGELIFRLVYEQAGCRKPMKRLWISSMEEQAIKDGFASLKDGSYYDSLYQSALCRAKADWLVGINASRLFSVLYNQNLKVGRVGESICIDEKVGTMYLYPIISKDFRRVCKETGVKEGCFFNTFSDLSSMASFFEIGSKIYHSNSMDTFGYTEQLEKMYRNKSTENEKTIFWFGIELVNGNDVEKKLMSFEYACNWNSLSGYVCALVAEWCLNDEISKGKAYNLDEIEGIQKIYRESSGRNKTEYS